MNKNFKLYAVLWAVLFAFYNVVIFLIRPMLPYITAAYDASFWIMWTIVVVAFVCNLFCAYVAFHGNNLQKMFLSVPVIRLSYICLIWILVIGSAAILIPKCPSWIPTIICVVIFFFQILSVVKTEWASETIEATEEKVKAKQSFIRTMTVEAENLMGQAKTDEAKNACKKVYEELRYSDPMSSEGLIEIETEISKEFESFSAKIKLGENSNELAEELANRIGDRNRKCKMLKLEMN